MNAMTMSASKEMMSGIPLLPWTDLGADDVVLAPVKRA
jgi:hypothetical protein